MLTSSQFAARLGITVQHARRLAHRVEGAVKHGRDWAIPIDAQHPDKQHVHEWGPLERSRFAGTVHRKCKGCEVINAYDDEEQEGE